MLDKEKKKHTRRLNRINNLVGETEYYPIDSIYNPQSFTESLFAKLRKCKFPFAVKL
jgi:hypothetical protein